MDQLQKLLAGGITAFTVRLWLSEELSQVYKPDLVEGGREGGEGEKETYDWYFKMISSLRLCVKLSFVRRPSAGLTLV